MSEPEHKTPSRLVRKGSLLLIPAMIGALAVYLLWLTNPDLEYWRARLDTGLDFLEANPWALLAAVATLPGLGFPMSPLLVLFGVVLAPRYGLFLACLLGVLSQTVCTIWTYLLASGPLREILTKFVSRKRELPQLNHPNALRLGLVMRITPGIPYALQNIVLGLLGMRLRPYLAVSLPINGLWTVGFIITGGALFEGRTGLAISGGLFLIVLVLLTKMLARKT